MKKQVEVVVVVVVVVLLLGTGPGPAGPPEPFRPEGWVVVGRCADVTDVVTGEFQPIGGERIENETETKQEKAICWCSVCVSAKELNMDVVLRQVYNLQVYE